MCPKKRSFVVLNHTNAITRFLAHVSNISACLLTWLMYYNTSNNTKNLEKKFRIRFRNWLQWWLIFVGTYLYLWMEFRLSLQILSINFVILSTQMVSTFQFTFNLSEWYGYEVIKLENCQISSILMTLSNSKYLKMFSFLTWLWWIHTMAKFSNFFHSLDISNSKCLKII